MDKIIFQVQGSAAEPYEVKFSKNGDNLSATCTCPAGENGIYCKHRFNIMQGISEGVVSQNAGDVDIVKSWLKGTDVEVAIKEVLALEYAIEKAKKDLSLAKKRLARAMRD